MKTGQVFVSHTSDMARFPGDRSFVQAALDAVSRAGLVPDDMRYFAAREGLADYCRQRVRGSDIYVAVIGFKYGSTVPGEAVSYSELEYNAASAAGLPRLVFLLSDTGGMPTVLADVDRDAVEKFRQRLRADGLIVRSFTSVPHLELEVFHALTELTASGSGKDFGTSVGNANPGSAIQSRNLIALSSVVGGRGATSNHGPDRLVPNQLPSDTRPFVGREQIIASLESKLRGQDRATGPIVLLTGMAGSGKTALAVHLAHKVFAEYPDGHIYVRLERSSDTAHHATEILGEVLGSFGLQVDAIPESLHMRAALYRSLLARRRVIVVLDGAIDTRQIRPLLPPGSSSAVIVTSRSLMPELEGATHVQVGALSPRESVQLLERTAGARLTADPHAALDLAAACGYLPLALRIAGALLDGGGDLTARDLVDRLLDVRQTFDSLASPEAQVNAIFGWSYRSLEEEGARAFRLLSLFPGIAFDVGAAAAILAISGKSARRLLNSLVSANLLDRQSNRYLYHNLSRAYGRSVSEQQDSQEDSAAALARLRQWYLNQVSRAVVSLSSASGVQAPGRLTRSDAVSWLETERENLLALVNDAFQTGDHDFVWQIADILYVFYQLRGHWADSQAVHETALSAARSVGNQSVVGNILNNLGVAYREQRHYDEAISCFEESLAAFSSIGSISARDLTLTNLGVAYRAIGELSQAISCFEAAVALAGEVGRTRTTGLALSNLGNVYRDMNRYGDALDAYQKGLSASRSVGDRYGEGITSMNLGLLHQGQGRWDEAATHYLKGLAITREVGDRVSEGRVLHNLGSTYAARGATADAIAEFENSLRTAREVGDAETIYLATRDLGDLELNRGQHRSAMECYRECHDAARTLGDPAKEAQAIVRLAADSVSAGEPEVALAYWRQAVEVFREGADYSGLASALMRTGAALAALQRPEEALACYEESAGICRDLGDPSGELVALTGLVSVYRDVGQATDIEAASRRLTAIRRAQLG